MSKLGDYSIKELNSCLDDNTPSYLEKLNSFLFDFERNKYKILEPEYPDEDNAFFQQVFREKRNGDVDEAIEDFIFYFNRKHEIYADLLLYFYKTLMVAQEYKGSLLMINAARIWLYHYSPVECKSRTRLLWLDAVDHWSRFFDAFLSNNLTYIKDEVISVSGGAPIVFDFAIANDVKREIVELIPKLEKMDYDAYLKQKPIFTHYICNPQFANKSKDKNPIVFYNLLEYVKHFKKDELWKMIDDEYKGIKGSFGFDALVGYRSAYGLATCLLATRFLRENFVVDWPSEELNFFYCIICFQFCGEIYGLIHYRNLIKQENLIKYSDFEDTYSYLEDNLTHEIQSSEFAKGLFPDYLDNPQKALYQNEISHLNSIDEAIDYYKSLGLLKNY